LSIAARQSIYIANPYFIPDEVAVAALLAARRRGVDVQIMVSGIHNDAWLARQNSVRLYGPLLEGGITVWEYNRAMLHRKTMVVDGIWGTVGTTNFDNRSFAHNEENNICVYDRRWATELQEVFVRDAKVCDRVAPKHGGGAARS
jgi:cardiolipin synthase